MSNCLNDPCNPCDPCVDPCVDSNPCYDNCGCLHPTTWECITQPGSTHIDMDVTNDMNGVQVLSVINAAIRELQAAIDDIVQPTSNSADKYAKISETDTTTGYLTSKLVAGSHLSKSLLNSGGNEQLRFNVTPATLISGDEGNLLALGGDGKLRVTTGTSSSGSVSLIAGSGVTISGDGGTSPYIISTNTSIQAARPCFDGVWRLLNITETGSDGVVKIAGDPKYRIRHDGTIEFKGTLTYTVSFGSYATGPRRFVETISSLPSTCLTLPEQNGVQDLKSISYIDIPQAGADQITQHYSYIIRKSANNIVLEFQSAFSVPTTKTIVISFDGAVSHPNI